MYRLLIVDDESIITDALYDVFRNIKSLDLDICKAYSGKSALELLSRTKIDIVMTDIRMPGIDGLELMSLIRSSWPQCKIILLTGYNEFDYVYKAIQYKDVKYLLKTEGYDKVIKTVEDTIAEIDRSLKMEDVINQANKQIQSTRLMLQKEYLLGLIYGEYLLEDINKDQFNLLQIEFDPEQSVIMLVARIDGLSRNISYSEKPRIAYSIQLISKKYFDPMTINMNITDGYTNYIWIIQPKQTRDNLPGNLSDKYIWEKTITFVKGMLEFIQAACKESLGLSISFAICNEPFEWKHIVEKYIYFKQLLDYRIGTGMEMILTERNLIINETISKPFQVETRLKKLGALETYLERGQMEDFYKLLNELTDCLNESVSMHNNSALQLYHAISLVFLSYINRWNITEKIAFRIGLSKLTRTDEHTSWLNATEYLNKLADVIFDIQNNEQEKRALDMISHVKKYIDENIQEEISLVNLADVVHFNPSYLSRLFKQVTKENLSDYIVDAKIRRAKRLLESVNVKIHDVSEAVGYSSAQNFTRFFKKVTNMTPQEYHDRFISSLQLKG